MFRSASTGRFGQSTYHHHVYTPSASSSVSGWNSGGGGGDGAYGPSGGHKSKGSTLQTSALTLLAFLFFINILNTCLKDQMISLNPTVQYLWINLLLDINRPKSMGRRCIILGPKSTFFWPKNDKFMAHFDQFMSEKSFFPHFFRTLILNIRYIYKVMVMTTGNGRIRKTGTNMQTMNGDKELPKPMMELDGVIGTSVSDNIDMVPFPDHRSNTGQNDRSEVFYGPAPKIALTLDQTFGIGASDSIWEEIKQGGSKKALKMHGN